MITIRRESDVERQDVSDGVEIVGATKQLLISPQDGAQSFAVRLFSLSHGGHTPRHTHPFEHGVVVVEGRGELVTPDDVHTLTPGTVAYIPPNEEHQFRNVDTEPFRFLCVVPSHAEG